jgi:hypothetical protein
MRRIKITVRSSGATYQECADPIRVWKMIDGDWVMIVESINVRKALNLAREVAAIHPDILSGNMDVVRRMDNLIANFRR